MATGWGAYSTPPLGTNVATPLAEGTLPPFPEHDEIVGEDKKLTPMWRRWFSKQRSWLTDRGAYTPTDIVFSGMGTAAVTGTPVFHWWKQGNIVQVYYDLQLTTVTVAGGACTTKPMPFDPTIRILQTGRTTVPLIMLPAMVLVAGVWTTLPCFIFNGKGASTGTYLQFLNVPSSAIALHASGTYITDN